MNRFTSGITECTRPEVDVRERGKPHWQDSLRFSGHFPGESGLAGVIEAKGDGDGDNWNTGAIIHAKLQSYHLVTNKPTSSFLQAGCPSSHPTNSVKALKG